MSINDISISRRHLYSLFSVFIMLFAVACEDENEEDPDHTDADGFVLETEDGVQAYREFKGAVTGSVSLSVGDTLHFMVHFLDHDGDEIEHMIMKIMDMMTMAMMTMVMMKMALGYQALMHQ